MQDDDPTPVPALARRDVALRTGRPWPTALLGAVALVAVVAASPQAARSAGAQVWPPFVLVTGLLLVGLVADGDGLFARAGRAWSTWRRVDGPCTSEAA